MGGGGMRQKYITPATTQHPDLTARLRYTLSDIKHDRAPNRGRQRAAHAAASIPDPACLGFPSPPHRWTQLV